MRRLAALGVVAALGVGWWWLREAPLPADFAFAWPAGTRDTYAVRWQSHDRTTAPGMDQPLTGELELRGELAMTSLGLQGEVYWLEVRFTKLDAHRVVMLDQDVLPDAERARANLIDHAAYVEIEPTGRIRSIQFPDAAPDLYKHLMQGLFGELQVVLAPGRAWTAELPTLHGRAQVAYTRDDHRLTRERTGYASVLGIQQGEHPVVSAEGTGTITLDRIGVIAAFDEAEQLRVEVDGKPRIAADHALHMVHLRRDRPTAIALRPPHLEERHLGEPMISDATEQRLLDQRVAGLTLEVMKTDLWDHANDGRMPDDHQWFSRASGYVIAHPEAAAKLAALFSDAHFNSLGRRLILDVLTAAGHPQAQAALRTALASPEARGDRAYTMMLQRISLVQAPTPETVAFIAETMRAASDRTVHMASAFSLGSAAGHLAAQDPSLARRYNDELRGELAAARDPEIQGQLLRAIGNVGLDDNRAIVLGHRSDPDATVRSAVASALHKDASPAANAALIGMAEDDSGLVQQSALGSLGQRDLSAGEASALSIAVTRNRITQANQPLVVSLLVARLDQAVAVDALRHVRDHTDDSQLKARIGSILMNRGLEP